MSSVPLPAPLASATAEFAAAIAVLITTWSSGLPETTPVTALIAIFFWAAVRSLNPSTLLSNASTAPLTPPVVKPLTNACPASCPVSTAPTVEVAAFCKPLVRVLVSSGDNPKSLIKDAPSFIKSVPGIWEPTKLIAAPLIASSISLPLNTLTAKLAAICSGIDKPPVAIARPICAIGPRSAIRLARSLDDAFVV